MTELRMGKPIRVNGTNIIPVEKVYLRNYALGKGFWLYGSKEPVSLVVCDAHGVRALNIRAHELSLTELIREVPGLEALLEEFASVGD